MQHFIGRGQATWCASQPALSITVCQDRVPALVVVRGELDIATGPLLAGVLEHLMQGRGVAVEVDLSGVSFTDSHGLAPIIDAGVRVRAATGATERLLALLGGQPPAAVPVSA